MAITANTASNSGGHANLRYSVFANALPTGLTLDTLTGIISGAATATGNFNPVIKVLNSGGNDTEAVHITVVDTAPTALAYSSNPATYTKGTAITANTASNSGGHANLRYSVFANALPTGLTLDTLTGVISGTATAIGNFNPVIKVLNSGGNDTEEVHITVNDTAPTALAYSSNPATYTKGTAITANTASNSGGHANLSYAVVSGALPAGLLLNPGTGAITGTATALGNFTPQIRVSNTGGADSIIVNITVVDTAPTALVYSSNPATYTKGVTITANTASNSGGHANLRYSVLSGALPTGLSLDTLTGSITGTATAIGNFNSVIKVLNTGGFDTETVVITVNDTAPTALAYSSNPATYSTVGAITPNTPSNSGGHANLRYSVLSGILPTGLSLDTLSGAITGTASVPGIYHPVIKVLNSGGNDTEAVHITVQDTAPATLSYITPVTYTVGTPIVTDSPTVTGGHANLRYSVFSGPLPTGLSLDSLSGFITGTPGTGVGTFPVVIRATNSGGFASANVSITVQDTAPATLTYTTPVTYTVGTAISANYAVVTGGHANLTFGVISGGLPNGLSLNTSLGTITGTPDTGTAGITYTPRIRVSNSGNYVDTIVSITVKDTAPATLSYSVNPVSATVGVAIVIDSPSVTGGHAHLSYSILSGGPLPTGLTLNPNGTISGTPANGTAGSYNPVINVHNSGGDDSEAVHFTVVDTAPTGLTYSANPATYSKGVAITTNSPSVTAGHANLRYSIFSGTLPTGLSLDTISGAITGTPDTLGTFSAVIQVANSGGLDTETVNITMNAQTPVISYATPVTYTKNVAISANAPVSTGGAVVSYSISPNLNANTGLDFSTSTGVISGTPTTVVSAANYTIIATNTGGLDTATVSIAVQDTSPAFAYLHATLSGVKHIAISPDTVVVTGTGAITGYTVSPALPAGLGLNPVTGLISGTPNVTAAGVNDTITATGPGGTGIAVVTITIIDTAPAISYTSPVIYGRTIAITPNNPVSTGGGIDSFLTSSLPVGLVVNKNTGIISGTPTVASSATNYTITAYGSGGTGNATVNIAVVNAPTGLSYTLNSVVYPVGTNITANNPTVTGTVTNYSVSPALPAGLHIDSLTGIITGNPTTETAAADYIVTASNIAGFTPTTITITILGPPTHLIYPQNTAVFGQNVTITPDTPMVTGEVDQYTVSPALPAGLSLALNTGIITGTPTDSSSAKNYVITASNFAGVTKDTVNFTVKLAPTALSYSPDSAVYVKNVAITNNVPSVTGIVTRYSISSALPAGLAFDTVTGVISGTPTAIASLTNRTVTAFNGPAFTTHLIKTTVKDTSPAITYKQLVVTATKNVAITPDTVVVTGTGAITSYAVNSELPFGLALSTSTGLISGTPTTTASVANYTVTATGPGGTGIVLVNITVTDTAPSVSYKRASITATKNVSILADTIVLNGTGAITGYALSGGSTLPSGVSLSLSTGVISGTPTTTFASKLDTVIATGPGGTGRATVTIAVVDTSPAVSYKRASISGTKNVAILADTIVVTGSGAITGYALSGGSTLPAGLHIDSLTGVISGTPTSTYASTVDTMIATGPGGTGLAIVTIAVADTSPAISYLRASISATKNVAILPDTIVVTGTGSITGYSVVTELPLGLNLSPSTGVISGAATVAASSANYGITATGPGGTGLATVTIAVTDTSPAISYLRASITGTKNTAILADTIVMTGTGAVTSYALSGGSSLPSGVSLSTSTGVISGTPIVTYASKIDTVIATGPGGTGRATVTIAVGDTAPSVSYKRASISGTKNVAIVPDTIVVTGTGSITGYALSGGSTLPSGVSLSTSTGVISGTPTATYASTIDTVVATGPGGTGRATVTIAVGDTAPAISYLGRKSGG